VNGGIPARLVHGSLFERLLTWNQTKEVGSSTFVPAIILFNGRRGSGVFPSVPLEAVAPPLVNSVKTCGQHYSAWLQAR